MSGPLRRAAGPLGLTIGLIIGLTVLASIAAVAPAAGAGPVPDLGGQFFAARGSEAALLSYAYAFEQATRARRAPHFLPTLG